MLKGGVHTRYMDAFIGCLKEGFMQWSLKTVSSSNLVVSGCTQTYLGRKSAHDGIHEHMLALFRARRCS